MREFTQKDFTMTTDPMPTKTDRNVRHVWQADVFHGNTILGFEEWCSERQKVSEKEDRRNTNPFHLYDDPQNPGSPEVREATRMLEAAIKLHAEVIVAGNIARQNSFKELDAVINNFSSLGACDTESYWLIIDSVSPLVKEIENAQIHVEVVPEE
jgi:hypothetical protein